MDTKQPLTSSADEQLRALLESEAIVKISQVLYQELTLEEIFGQVVHEVIGIIHQAYRAVIHLYDERNQRLHAVALAEKKNGDIETKTLLHLRVNPSNEFDFDLLEEEDLRFASMRAGEGVAGRAIETGEGIMVGETRGDKRFIQSGTTGKMRAIVVAPILDNQQRLGTLSILGNAPNLFGEADQHLLEKLCLQVAAAIRNARLLESERQQRALAQAQTEISALLNQTLSMDEILAGILNHTRRFFGARAANVMLVREGRLEVVRKIGYAPGDIPERGEYFDILALPEGHHILKAYQEGITILADDTQAPEWQNAGLIGWIRSFACIPLKIGSRVIGVLNVDSERVDAFSEREKERLETFANSAAAAVNNAQLYNELSQALQTETETRQQLIRADKLTGMGRMVASVAHELNNPLQTIRNCLFLIEQSYQGQEDADLLELALSEVGRLTAIVNRLRDVYRPAQSDQFMQISLPNLLQELEPLLETHLRRNQVSLNFQIDDLDEVSIMAYPDQLKQVFLNLSLNAIEAMQPEGGELTVSTQIEAFGNQVGVAFSDTGAGIPAEDLKVIFDPFYTTKSTGLGLGLSICYDIAHNHGGVIDVSNNTDRGATFSVWLPIAHDQEKGRIE